MSESSIEQVKPRLLFFRWTRPGQPQFLLNQLAEHLACLRLFFEVELVDHACDYDEVCDRFQPDLVLFESGVYVGPRQVTNVHTHPDVPKLGFLNADAFDPVRAVFVSDMAEWGVETFFTVSLSMAEYTPELADRLFFWPNFIDPTIHRDHGLPKVVPIILTGSQARHYPWRNRVSRVLEQHHPVLAMPHFGWSESSGTGRMSIGESYSRLINSAAMAPTCGSFTRDLVRKHLEIPGARTCLITERTPAVEAAGYVDMLNCVFADADDVLDKVDHLLRNPDQLASITDAGFELVHGRHTGAQRRQLRDWYDLYAASGSSEGIVQTNPFGSLRRESRESRAGLEPPPAAAGAADRVLIRTGWGSLARGRHAAAVRAFTGASNFQYMPEAEVGKAFAQLQAGAAAEADATILTLLDHDDRLYGPADPDPVQWAMHARALLCQGRLEEARAGAAAHPGLRHQELQRVRAVVATLTEGGPTGQVGPPRASVNPLPPATWPDWLATLRDLLDRNGQRPLADRLSDLAGQPDPATRLGSWQVTAAGSDRSEPEPRVAGPARAVATARRQLSRLRATVGEQARETARRWVTAEWLDALSDAAEREELETVLLVAPSRFSLRERSLRLAVARNPRMPELVYVEPGRATSIELDGRPTLVYLGRRLEPPRELVGVMSHARHRDRGSPATRRGPARGRAHGRRRL